LIYKFIKVEDNNLFCGYIQAQNEFFNRIAMIDKGQEKMGEKIAQLLSKKGGE